MPENRIEQTTVASKSENERLASIQPPAANVPWWAPLGAGIISGACASIGAALLAIPGAQIAGIILVGIGAGFGAVAGVMSKGRGNPP